MKVIGILSTAVLSFLLGTAPPACGQQEEKRETDAKPAQQEEKRAQPEKPAQQEEKHATDAKPVQQEEKRAQPEKPTQQEEKHATEAKPVQQEDRKPQPEKPGQQGEKRVTDAKPAQQETQHTQQQQTAQQPRGYEPKRTEQEQHVQSAAWQQHRTQNWQSDHRTWQQRGGYNGYRIPDDRFRVNFGPDHEFRISGLPFLVVGGYPRFQYGGYWFSAVDPWPESWADDWYDTDDVYVVYVDNGYYLYNRRYPTVGIAISISL